MMAVVRGSLVLKVFSAVISRNVDDIHTFRLYISKPQSKIFAEKGNKLFTNYYTVIEKYKRNKETKKLQIEIEELRRLRKVSIMMLIRTTIMYQKDDSFYRF